MRFQPWGSVCLLVVGLVAFLQAAPLVQADEPAASSIVDAAEAKIRVALEQRLDWEFLDTPLSDVAELMADALSIDVLLDKAALDEFGIDSDTSVTFLVRSISTRSFLRLMLRELDLTYVIRDSALVITTFDEAEAELVTRVYPVADIVAPDASDEGLAECGSTPLPYYDADYDTLIETITSNIYPDTWDTVGGPGSIEGIYRSLVISQTEPVHELVEELLVTYRQLMKADSAPEGLGVEPWMLGRHGEAHLRPALDKPLTAIIRDEPLIDVVSMLSEEFQVPIIIDTFALDDSGIDSAAPVTGRFAEVPLGVALKRLLDPVELTYTLRDEVILITTPVEEEAMLQLGLYPVGELVGDGSGDPANYDFDSLIQVITSTVAPNSWDEVGGPAAVDVLLPAPVLVISQTYDVHEQIGKLLVTLQAAKRQVPEKEAIDPEAITLKAYQPLLGFYDSDAIVGIILRDSKEGTWDEENVFIESLGPAIIIKHNAKVHQRVQKVLKELGVWWRPGINQFQGGGGTVFGSGGAAGGNAAPANPQPQAGAGLGGFF